MKKYIALAVGIALIGAAAIATAQFSGYKKTPVGVDSVKFDYVKFTNAVYFTQKDPFFHYDSITGSWITDGWVTVDGNATSATISFSPEDMKNFIDYVKNNTVSFNKFSSLFFKWNNGNFLFDGNAANATNKLLVTGSRYEVDF